MAFSSLASSLYNVGKPVVQSIFSTLKGNQDDLNSRLLTVEGAINKIDCFNGILVNVASGVSTISGAFGIYEAQSAFTLTDAVVGIFDVSGPSWSGTLRIDVQKSSSLDFSSSVSVFTTKPSISFSSPTNYTQSSNAAFSLVNKDVGAGDFLRVDIDALPSGGVLGLIQVKVTGEAS